MKRLRAIRLGDMPLFFFVVALSIFGIAMVYSAGVLDVPSQVVTGIWKQQLMWFALAMLLVPFVLRVPVAWLEWAAQPAYAFALVLLVLTLFIGGGAGTAESSSSWIQVGPVRLQTSEIGKVSVVLMLSRVLGEWREAPQNLFALWKPIGVVMIPMGLVMLQPDLGTALVFASILIWSLFWAGTPLRTLFLLISPAIGLFLSINPWLWGGWIIAVAILLFRWRVYLSEAATVVLVNIAAGTVSWMLWASLKPYQKNRFLVFLDPSVDPRGAGYNLIQSRVAIGSGGWFGKGFTEGTQKRLAFLPEQHTDFIFSVIGEEWGFVGVCMVLLLFGLIFWRLVRIAEKSSDPFASLVPFGLFGSWFAHVLVNVGMTVGIMPITGIPLPFISYGGSFLLVNIVAMAIVQRIAAEGRR
ncbi:MAG TPA: rod shape-determining protein RodA [Longimicrobiaceae bacterium]|nr:rod shape-determining protein RodA [Longimicrobiaceae bacterium]